MKQLHFYIMAIGLLFTPALMAEIPNNVQKQGAATSDFGALIEDLFSGSSSNATMTKKPATPLSTDKTADKEADEDQAYLQKMNAYVRCFNNIQEDINLSSQRYASWLKDLQQGPSGRETTIYGIYNIMQQRIDECASAVQSFGKLTPALEPLDKLMAEFVAKAAPLVKTINEMHDYYEQEDYKDDAFRKGKVLHSKFYGQFKDYKATDKQLTGEITRESAIRESKELTRIEKQQGKNEVYYAVAIMIKAKEIFNTMQQENFDAVATLDDLADLAKLVKQMEEKKIDNERNIRFSANRSWFMKALNDYQLDAKRYCRRIRDKTPYSSGEKMLIRNGNSDMVAGSPQHLFKTYNELVKAYNRLGR